MADSAPKRRLPFKPTALRKNPAPPAENPKSPNADDDLALFKRSAEILPIIAAENELRAKREKAEKEARMHRSGTVESRTTSRATSVATTPGSAQSKPRASSTSSGAAAEDHCLTPTRASPSSSAKRRRSDAEGIAPRESETPTKRRYSPSDMPPPSHSLGPVVDDAPIPLDFGRSPSALTQNPGRPSTSGSDDVVFIGAGQGSPVEIVDVAEEDDDDKDLLVDSQEEEQDPALKAYIAAAQERNRLEKEAEGRQKSNGRYYLIQIDSQIPRTKATTFRQPIADPLRKARNTWCAVMRLNHHAGIQDDEIFLTWRGNRLYNMTTLKGLGIEVMGDSYLYAGDDMGEGAGFSADRKKVVLEAWTEQLYEEAVAAKERDRLRLMGELDEVDAAPEAPPEEKIKITMRARQGEPVKVSVPVSATVAALVDKFRAKRHIPENINVTIHFDGEELAEGVSLADADIGDEDQVEVHMG